jgi:hypothetical protein
MDLFAVRAALSEGKPFSRMAAPSLGRTATIAARSSIGTLGTLSRPPQRLCARQPPRFGLRDEVAPPLRFSQDAVSLHRAPETAQQAFLRFTFSQLDKHAGSSLDMTHSRGIGG